MTLVLRILALIFEFSALGLFVVDIVKDRKKQLTPDVKVIIRDGIILCLWASNTCLAILLMR